MKEKKTNERLIRYFITFLFLFLLLKIKNRRRNANMQQTKSNRNENDTPLFVRTDLSSLISNYTNAQRRCKYALVFNIKLE